MTVKFFEAIVRLTDSSALESKMMLHNRVHFILPIEDAFFQNVSHPFLPSAQVFASKPFYSYLSMELRSLKGKK